MTCLILVGLLLGLTARIAHTIGYCAGHEASERIALKIMRDNR